MHAAVEKTCRPQGISGTQVWLASRASVSREPCKCRSEHSETIIFAGFFGVTLYYVQSSVYQYNRFARTASLS